MLRKILLIFLIPFAVHADDIEIFISSSSEGDGEATSHNILFSMDTSGSMDWLIPTLYSGGGYDPNEDYGAEEDRVYIYDLDMNYLERSFPTSQSRCGHMEALFSSTSSYPVHTDRMIQWQSRTDTVTVPGECRDVVVPGGEGSTVSSSGSVSTNSYFGSRKTRTLNVTAGSSFEFTITTDRYVSISQIFSTKSNNSNSLRYYDCTNNNSNRWGDTKEYTCRGTLPSNHVKLKVQFYVYRDWYTGQKKTNYNLVAQLDGEDTVVTECDPDTTENLLTNDWRSELLPEDSPTAILECEQDAGTHGINDGSLSVYARSCPFGDECTDPLYTSSWSLRRNYSGNQYNFVPANFHAYLQSGGSVDDLPDPLPQADADDICVDSSSYNSAYVDYIFQDTDTGLIVQCRKKIHVMKEALNNVVDSLTDQPVNIGLQRFNGGSGGYIVDKIESIATGKADFINKVNALPASGSTPLQESLWESYLYFDGKQPANGDTSGADSGVFEGSGDNKKYISPIVSACQTNNIILLTDGAPSSDQGFRTQIQNFSGDTCGSSSGACLDELAGGMNEHDFGPAELPGQNNVSTYTIGFNLDLALLADTARKGGGEYFTAYDTAELTNSFKKIISEILATEATFVAPAISVNAFNELQHRDELYYALFRPSALASWTGNIKKYRIKDGDIVDVSGKKAVDSGTGLFIDSAQSYWSDEPDGSVVTLGGLASKISNDRNVFTDITGDLLKIDKDNLAAFENVDFEIHRNITNEQILRWMVGEDVTDENGNNQTNDANRFLADPLHTPPTVVTFGGNAEAPEDVVFYTTNLGTIHAADPADNSGEELWVYWPSEHKNNPAIYIEPDELEIREYGIDGMPTFVVTEGEGSKSSNFSVSNVKMFIGERRGGSNYYALDVTNSRTSETAPFTPLWKINGKLRAKGDYGDGTGVAAFERSGAATIGFDDLGQSWSQMVSTKIKTANGEEDVLIFTGGYDPRHDSHDYTPSDRSTTDTEYGNAIYVVRQSDGSILFSVGNNKDQRGGSSSHTIAADMIYSMPATPSVIDADADGYADLIYAIDITGNIWRVDFDQSKSIGSSDFGTVGVIFSLSDIDDNRKFYNQIDISKGRAREGSNHLNLIVGSGYRASPRYNESVLNRLYVVYDDYPYRRSLDETEEEIRYSYFEYKGSDETLYYRPVIASDLVQSTPEDPVTKNTPRLDENGDALEQTVNGFYINFSIGEKIMQSTITFNSKVLFASYVPSSGSTSGACTSGNLGGGRIYLLDLLNGTSVLGDEQFIEVIAPGIPVEPSLIFTEDGLEVCVGTQCISKESDYDDSEEEGKSAEELFHEGLGSDQIGEPTKTYWREE